MSTRRYEYVAIIGSRSITTHDEVFQSFKFLRPEKHVIISGGASGVDTIVKEIAKTNGFHYIEVPAFWSRGRGAGLARNSIIADVCDKVIAVWDGVSRGTNDTVDKAVTAGKSVEIIVNKHGGS